tara:strand:+ start:33425 stop:34120 length:696 start_codon:yes stop_codon:yes gene_type:complete
MACNPLIIKSNIETLHNIYNSKTFISKIFDCTKDSIIEDDGVIKVQKNYTINDLEKMFIISPYIRENIIPKIKNINIQLNILQNVVFKDDNLLIIKYISTIDKPSYVKNMLADQSTVFYIKIYPTNEDKSLLLVNYIRKFIPTGDDEINNDENIIDDINILNIDNTYDTIQFNQGLLMTAGALLGEDTVNDIIIPFIYKIFDDFIDNILNKRIKNFLRKKKIDVYTKKQKT